MTEGPTDGLQVGGRSLKMPLGKNDGRQRKQSISLERSVESMIYY